MNKLQIDGAKCYLFRVRIAKEHPGTYRFKWWQDNNRCKFRFYNVEAPSLEDAVIMNLKNMGYSQLSIDSCMYEVFVTSTEFRKTVLVFIE